MKIFHPRFSHVVYEKLSRLIYPYYSILRYTTQENKNLLCHVIISFGIVIFFRKNLKFQERRSDQLITIGRHQVDMSFCAKGMDDIGSILGGYLNYGHFELVVLWNSTENKTKRTCIFSQN